METPILGSLLLLALISMPILSSSSSSSSCDSSFPAIYAFGDSLTDTGNYGVLEPSAASMKFPYGETFFHHPNGRFSDGRLVIDFIAESLGMPLLKPSFKGGTNFAVAGITALNSRTLERANVTSPTSLSLEDEIKSFQQFRNNVCFSKERCLAIEVALFYFGEIGGNDISYLLNSNTPWEEIKEIYVPMVMVVIKQSIKELIESGAKYVIIQGIYPMGCLPSMSKVKPQGQDGCSIPYNAITAEYNARLKSIIDDLRKHHENVKFVYFDASKAFLEIMDNAKKYGFAHPPMVSCYVKPLEKICSNPQEYMSWDTSHLTEGMYKKISHLFLKGNPLFSHSNFIHNTPCNINCKE